MNKFQQLGKFKTIKGTILSPESSGLSFILNIVNKTNKLENLNSLLFPLFDKKWKKVKEDTKGWYTTQPGTYKLGATHDLAVQSDVWIQTLLCQDENGNLDSKALNECLKKVFASAKFEQATIHVSHLLLEAFPQLKEGLIEHFVNKGIHVFVYEEK